jgi:hypothetical protein
MRKFDFMVQNRDGVVTPVNRSVALPNSAAAWPLIVELAYNIEEPGAMILVASEAGEIVIRIGIASARSLANVRSEVTAS